MTDIVERLRKWDSETHEPNTWGPPLTKLLNDAADEIERLRRLAGAVSPGESFSDLRKAAKAAP